MNAPAFVPPDTAKAAQSNVSGKEGAGDQCAAATLSLALDQRTFRRLAPVRAKNPDAARRGCFLRYTS
jgi:hypothetical protein